MIVRHHFFQQHCHNNVHQGHSYAKHVAHKEERHSKLLRHIVAVEQGSRYAFGPRLLGEDLEHGVQRQPEIAPVVIAILQASSCH
eukprot:Skav200931  [mRNA]  locus=scaffold2433:275576:279714:+ [translate_table: standard]